LWARKHYYAHAALGTALVAPLIAMEVLCPELRRWFVAKERFATADAQLLLGFLNLYAITGDDRYLQRSVSLGEELLAESIPGYRGPCWGYPFDWRINKDEVWHRDTPFITCTPYCYEAYVGLFEATKDRKHLEIAARIAEFVHGDLRDSETGPDSAAGSYSPSDRRRVVNASAYRAFVLYEAGMRFARQDFLETARRNLNFVLDSQQNDGSWHYAMEGQKSFIDNFHTCFNLKNLFKTNRLIHEDRVEHAIQRGFGYYQQHLVGTDGYPRPFAVRPRFQLAVFEIYDFAEAITLGSLLGTDHPDAAELAIRLAKSLISEYQTPPGYFVTRVYRGGIRHRYPFIRWPQAQCFLALTNLIIFNRCRSGESCGQGTDPYIVHELINNGTI